MGDKHTGGDAGGGGAITARFEPGDVISRRELTTITADRVPVPTPEGLTHLQFRRFSSCPICNVHLRSVARRHDEIVAAGVREIVVFHSSTEEMLPHQGELPFAAIPDPKRRLYAEFGVESSWRSVLHPRAWTAPLKPYAWSVARRERRAGRGKDSSDPATSPLGLPADFLFTSKGRLAAVKYGRHANDQWSVDELLALAGTPSTG